MSNIHHLIKVHYPQALSILVSKTRDIELAEDLLQSSIEKALNKWPVEIPDNPLAWLIKVSINLQIDISRKNTRFQHTNDIESIYHESDLTEDALLANYNDDLLRLIFTCCHPAINQDAQIILTLKHVLGLSVDVIANALVQKNKTIEQRLTRAKKKISQAGIPYTIPKPNQWPARVSSVLKTIYLLFNEGYFCTQGENLVNKPLCREAIRLARMMHACVKNDANVVGLLALLLQQYARIEARVSDNKLVLLENQDRKQWHQESIAEANILTEKAILLGGRTSYAIQAAIASLHNNAKDYELTDWQQIYALYIELIKIDANPIIKLNASIALAKTGKLGLAISEAEKLAQDLSNYRHYHTAIAQLYRQNQQSTLANHHFKLALNLSCTPHEQRFIEELLTQ